MDKETTQPAPVQEPVAHLWQCLGRWSAYLAQNGAQADLAPPSWLVDAIKNATPPAQPANLVSVVQAHIKDLRACLPTLLGYAELAQTAAEVEKAADELEAALNAPPAQPAPAAQPAPVQEELAEAQVFLGTQWSEEERAEIAARRVLPLVFNTTTPPAAQRNPVRAVEKEHNIKE